MWFVPFSLRDLVDIVVVAWGMYWIYRSTKGTNAPYILTGVIALYVLWLLVRTLNMELLSMILGQIISVGVIALLIVFQPEIRRFLQMIGLRQKSFRFLTQLFGGQTESGDVSATPIVEAVKELSKRGLDATIVLAQLSDLRLITLRGIQLDAKLSEELVVTLFAQESPLKGGALVVAQKRVVASGCELPMTLSPAHEALSAAQRGAIGLSEISDAIVITVCGESGEISISHSGQIYQNIEEQNLGGIITSLTCNDDEIDM
ncbi:MAG: diadenylate cyclase [Rikenellaceae bacterium]